MLCSQKILLLFSFPLACVTAVTVEYPDRPLGLSAKGAAVIDSYAAEAKLTLGTFNRELLSPAGRRF